MTRLQPQPVPDAPGTPLPLLPRHDPIEQLPILILYPHSRCNCRCLMCDIWRASTSDELATEDIARWLAEWRAAGVQRVVLSGGEALLHSQIWQVCDLLRAADIGITLLSTGILLRRHATALVGRCDDVVVSLDGPQPIHDQIRAIPSAYAKLAQGVAAVKAASSAVTVTGRCTVQRANIHALRATVAAAHDLGLDRISFLAADVSSEAFNRPDGWSSERTAQVAPEADELPVLRAELDALEREHAADFASGFIAEPPIKLRQRLLQYYAALHGQGDFFPNTCNAPWVSSVIEADGTVRPCFFQPPLGNIHQTQSLLALLNAPEAVKWRRSLDTQRDPICRRCVCTLSLRAPAADD